MNRLAELVKELEEEITEWKIKPSVEENCEQVMEALKDFCWACPLKDGAECVLCFLHKWRNGMELG